MANALGLPCWKRTSLRLLRRGCWMLTCLSWVTSTTAYYISSPKKPLRRHLSSLPRSRQLAQSPGSRWKISTGRQIQLRSVLIMSSASSSASEALPTKPSATVPPTPLAPGDVRFGKFVIAESCVFYRSAPNSSSSSSSSTESTAAFVNLRPIVPGHVLIIPYRIVPTLKELTTEEYLDLWQTVRIVQRLLSEHDPTITAFNVSVQDGAAAGQSVPHVHVHVLPRRAGDLARNDEVYDQLEAWAPRPGDKVPPAPLAVPHDDQRRDRRLEEMAQEAATYRALVESWPPPPSSVG